MHLLGTVTTVLKNSIQSSCANNFVCNSDHPILLTYIMFAIFLTVST